MDNSSKHCPVNEAFEFSSPLISVGVFKEQCALVISRDMLYNTEKNDDQAKTQEKKLENVDADKEAELFASLLKTDKQTIQELQEVCSIDNLKCDYDDQYDYTKVRAFEDFPENTPLQTVRLVKQGKGKQEEIYYAPTLAEPEVEEINDGDDLVPDGEVLLYVAIYQPDKRRTQQEFFVLPSQKLTEFRDLINCPADGIISGEFSDKPDLTGTQSAKELTYSSFFFIENFFYNDTRNPLNRDYSRVITAWAKESERYTVPGLGLFQSAEMQGTTFNDLQIRLGYPYLFCHQGNCEHIVVFSDMRVMTEQDPRKLSSYPYKISELLRRHRRCSICKIHLIKWMTQNDALAFEDPSFFCEKCFRYLHYSKDGKKLATFQAFPYSEID